MKLSEESVSRIAREFADLELGDPRRTRRIVKMVEALARAPQSSFPEAMGTAAALEAAYRVLNNEHFDFDDLLSEHEDRTIARAEEAGEVLAIHDTTTCVLENAETCEVGYLPSGKAGFFVHLALVVDARRHRRPLGVVHVEPYWREQQSARGGRQKHLSGADVAKWSGKEAERWARGVQHSQEQLSNCSVIHVMDREADKYELIHHMREHGQRYVLRSRHDRQLSDDTKLRQALAQRPMLLEREVYVSKRAETQAPRSRSLNPQRPARSAKLRVCAATVNIVRPRAMDKSLADTLKANVVHVEEVDAPIGQRPLSWTLFTSEPVDSVEQVERVIDIYRYRWLIEEFFKALKSGCNYEKRYFEGRHALLNLLATCLPIAVELLWMRARVAEDPSSAPDEIVTPVQLEVLRAMGHRPLPATPTAGDVLLAIAALGGHIKQNGAPGWQVLYRGYKRLMDYQAGWEARARATAPPRRRKNL